MSTVTIVGALALGVEIGEVLHRDFELRPATLRDTYRAAESVPVPADLAANDSARVAYQMAVDDAVILCQIVRLGTLSPVPSPAALAAELEPDDMVILRQTAADVKKNLQALRAGLPTTAAPSLSSSAPG